MNLVGALSQILVSYAFGGRLSFVDHNYLLPRNKFRGQSQFRPALPMTVLLLAFVQYLLLSWNILLHLLTRLSRHNYIFSQQLAGEYRPAQPSTRKTFGRQLYSSPSHELKTLLQVFLESNLDGESENLGPNQARELRL